jgi:hypothetical protein
MPTTTISAAGIPTASVAPAVTTIIRPAVMMTVMRSRIPPDAAITRADVVIRATRPARAS